MKHLLYEPQRHEMKFVTDPGRYHWLIQQVLLHPAGFYRPYPQRRVNNIYFDTYEYGAYAENIAGGSQRVKVRYRWYGEGEQPGPGTLEVKCKRNLAGWKLSFPVPQAPEGTTWAQIRQGIRRQLEPEARHWLDHNPMPVILNRYDRDYFVSRDERVRITVDRNPRVLEQRFKSTPNLDHPANIPQTMVLEMKYAVEDQDLAAQISDWFPLRLSRHSKYVIGLGTLARL